MYGLGVNRLGATSARGGRVPESLFASGEEGAWYDPSDLSTMFQNSDGTGAPVVDSPVGYIADKSGNGNHAIQATSSKRPTLKQDGALYYLEFEGAQGLATFFPVDFTGTDEMTVTAGVTKDTLDTAVIAELSGNVTGNVGTFRLAAISTASGLYRFQSRGDGTAIAANASPFGVGTNVLTGIGDISGPECTIRVDGTQEASVTTTQGAGNYGNKTLNIGARSNATSLFLDGRIYGLIVRGATCTATELADLESYMTARLTALEGGDSDSGDSGTSVPPSPPSPSPTPANNLTLYSSDGVPWVDSNDVIVTDSSVGLSAADISTKLSSV